MSDDCYASVALHLLYCLVTLSLSCCRTIVLHCGNRSATMSCNSRLTVALQLQNVFAELLHDCSATVEQQLGDNSK